MVRAEPIDFRGPRHGASLPDFGAHDRHADLAPGSIATEGTLIERVGLGRTPVREAIQRLAWEGLLEVRPRAGMAIAPLHAADWLRVLDARRGVEKVLARWWRIT